MNVTLLSLLRLLAPWVGAGLDGLWSSSSGFTAPNSSGEFPSNHLDPKHNFLLEGSKPSLVQGAVTTSRTGLVIFTFIVLWCLLWTAPQARLDFEALWKPLSTIWRSGLFLRGSTIHH